MATIINRAQQQATSQEIPDWNGVMSLIGVLMAQLLIITNHLWVGTNQLRVVAKKLERLHVRCWWYGLQKERNNIFHG